MGFSRKFERVWITRDGYCEGVLTETKQFKLKKDAIDYVRKLERGRSFELYSLDFHNGGLAENKRMIAEGIAEKNAAEGGEQKTGGTNDNES